MRSGGTRNRHRRDDMPTLGRADPRLEHGGSRSAGQPAAEEPRTFRFGRRDHLINLGFWTLFGAMTAATFLSNDHEPGGDRRVVPETIYWLLHSYVWAAFTPLIFWLVWRFCAHRPNRFRHGAILVGAGLGIAALVDLLQGLIWEQVMGPPPFGWRSDGGGFLGRWVRMDDEAVMCAAIFLAGFLREQLLRSRSREEQAIHLHARAAESEAHAAHLQAQLARARLAVLRSQLNPHFLFNSLNALSTLVDDDPRGAQRMIARLSELLRFALEAREEEEIPLHRELMLTQRYLEILEIRYEGRLTTRVSADPEVRDALVPNLILQPLVENAMKHGVGKAGGRGSIEVEVRRAGDFLLLTVSDSGGGGGAHARMEPGMEGSGTGLGLQNTRARLQELYGSEQRLRLAPNPDGGMVAEIVLPYHARPGDNSAPEPAPAEEGAHA
jgi:two-component system LytT family sensor kinase